MSFGDHSLEDSAGRGACRRSWGTGPVPSFHGLGAGPVQGAAAKGMAGLCPANAL